MMKETEDLESSFPLSSASDGLEGDSPHVSHVYCVKTNYDFMDINTYPLIC